MNARHDPGLDREHCPCELCVWKTIAAKMCFLWVKSTHPALVDAAVELEAGLLLHEARLREASR